MFRLKRLFLGSFISGLVVLFGWWINSAVMFNVTEITTLPSKQSGRILADSTANSKHSNLINTEPMIFSNASYQWQEPEASRLDGMQNLVSEELSKYSSEYLGKVGLKKIILVSKITTYAGHPVLGFADPLKGEIYLNTIDIIEDKSRNITARQTLHHELAHLLAYINYGYWFDRDSGWSKLEQLSDYGRYHSSDSELFPKEGYVSRYAMTSASEDFAEVYSMVFTDYYLEILNRKVSSDSTIKEKAAFVYESIANVDSGYCSWVPTVSSVDCER